MKNNKCGALEKSFARKNELLVLTSYNITYAVDFPHNKPEPHFCSFQQQ